MSVEAEISNQEICLGSAAYPKPIAFGEQVRSHPRRYRSNYCSTHEIFLTSLSQDHICPISRLQIPQHRRQIPILQYITIGPEAYNTR